MKIVSPAFAHNENIPVKYTCDGENISPPLQINAIPDDAASLVLLLEDPDAPSGLFIHWVLYDIPASVETLPENTRPPGISGVNDFGKTSYGGPCPPSGTHRYFFKLFALNSKLELPPAKKRNEVRNAMESHVIAQAELIGLYGRR
jgi:hypothetical protein